MSLRTPLSLACAAGAAVLIAVGMLSIVDAQTTGGTSSNNSSSRSSTSRADRDQDATSDTAKPSTSKSSTSKSTSGSNTRRTTQDDDSTDSPSATRSTTPSATRSASRLAQQDNDDAQDPQDADANLRARTQSPAAADRTTDSDDATEQRRVTRRPATDDPSDQDRLDRSDRNQPDRSARENRFDGSDSNRIDRQDRDDDRFDRSGRSQFDRSDRSRFEREDNQFDRSDRSRFEREDNQFDRSDRSRFEREEDRFDRSDRSQGDRSLRDQDRFDRDQVDRNRFDRDRFERDRFERDQFDRDRFDRDRFDRDRFDRDQIDRRTESRRDRREVLDDRRTDTRSEIDRDERFERRDTRVDARFDRDVDIQSQQIDLGVRFTETQRGLLVSNVTRTSFLADAGLRADDVIVAVAGRRVTSPMVFERLLISAAPADEVPIIIMRDGRQRTIYVEVDERLIDQPAVVERRRYAESEGDPLLGIYPDRRYQDAAVILEVIPNSAADRAGLRAGDMIISINGRRLRSPDHVSQVVDMFDPGEEIVLEVARRQSYEVPVRLGSSARHEVGYRQEPSQATRRDGYGTPPPAPRLQSDQQRIETRREQQFQTRDSAEFRDFSNPRVDDDGGFRPLRNLFRD